MVLRLLTRAVTVSGVSYRLKNNIKPDAGKADQGNVDSAAGRLLATG